jgi:osmoprotectant transport system ATP-binding protein
MVEGPVKGAQSEGAVPEQIPIKRLHVPDVKNNAVPLGNGPLVHGLFANQTEELVGSHAGVKQAGVKVVPDADSCGKCSHLRFTPSFGCSFRAKDAPKFGAGRLGALRCSRQVLRLSIEMNTKPMNFPGNRIEFCDVAFHINDIPARIIVSGISLTIPQGETLVLLGRSGSGKTTLLKLINGMLMPSKGRVLVQDRATADWDPIRLRRGIGYVIQDAGLFPHFTVAENVALVPTLEEWDATRTAARVEEMLKLVGLDPREFSKRRPRELSGGQRQRVGVARALAADPSILLMDEPFGALDPVTRAELQREFSALARRLGKTIVFVTHDLREALLLASRIVLLEAGRMVASAAPQEFLHLDHPEVRAFTSSLSVSPGAFA